MMRVGLGYDVHRFGEGDHIVLGGVKIAHSRGLVAHSDGDVLIHAVCDALLGAAAMGDIGRHFPDTDAQYANISGSELLRRVWSMLDGQYCLNNIDVTVIAQAPKIAPHIQAMQRTLADLLHVDMARLNIKATTTEKLGFAGRQEGIAVHAVALVEQL